MAPSPGEYMLLHASPVSGFIRLPANRPMSHSLLPRTQSTVIELLFVSSNTIGGGIHTE